MNVNRRRFLGTSIGMFLGTQIPFVAVPCPKIRENVSWESRILRMLNADENTLKRFKIILHTADGYDFLGPKMKEIVRPNELEINFRSCDLTVTRAMTITSGRLLDDENCYIRDCDYPLQQNLTNGDTLASNFCFKIG